MEEIYRVKGRPENRALPILVNSVAQAALLGRELPPNFFKLAKAFWPGALTIVVDAAHSLPLKVTANKGRVALRWPNSPVACAIIEQLGGADYRDQREHLRLCILLERAGISETAWRQITTDPG